MLITYILAILLDVIPGGNAFMKQIPGRDSILVGDQFEYGFELPKPKEGTVIELGDYSKIFNDTLVLVRNWQIDSVYTKKKLSAVRGTMVVSPFEEGKYQLPPVPVRITVDGKTDTLMFDPVEIEVVPIPVDTATFVIKDLKEQITYPVTFKEVVPYAGGSLVGIGLVFGLVVLLRMLIRKKQGVAQVHKDPAHVVALRELDKYRGDKYWAPDKQKVFYSGITDALKNYIDGRYGVDAPEMTTSDLFDALKTSAELTPELYNELKTLFETADFVKFAKHVAPDEYNSKALPLAVRFVTTTYEAEIQQEGGTN